MLLDNSTALAFFLYSTKNYRIYNNTNTLSATLDITKLARESYHLANRVIVDRNVVMMWKQDDI